MWQQAEEELSKDKYLKKLIEKYGHCTINVRLEDDYFEDLCSAIVGQQLSGKAADAIFAKFKKTVIEITPEAILKVEDQALRNSGLSWAKVKYIKDLAKRTHEGSLETKNLSNLSDENIEKELTAVKGIGKWTAQMFLMFTLGRADIFPSGDLGIKNGIKKLTGKEMKPEEMEKFAERWKPYRTVASWYIWRNLDNR
ncbi:MAG TPA: DNA-3-methyladenine glycosylase [Patescibacteria group bacterium]|nr:DNA-3-methyladenine glycosylase [Patescibacteria group bacterium]